MPEYFMGLALSALWFCAWRTKYGCKQHTQSWGGQAHSTAPTLCTDKSSLHKSWRYRKNNRWCDSDETVFLLSTSIISRALPARAMEKSPTAWIRLKASTETLPVTWAPTCPQLRHYPVTGPSDGLNSVYIRTLIWIQSTNITLMLKDV